MNYINYKGRDEWPPTLQLTYVTFILQTPNNLISQSPEN